MFSINEDMSIYVTRGDSAFFTVGAEERGATYRFKVNDVVRIKVFGKKDADNVVLQKDFIVEKETDGVNIFLSGQDTKIGDVISKPIDYWYEVELNPFTNPQTIIGYDDDGAKIFKLFPEGRDLVDEPKEELPDVDEELDLTSTRPVQNQAVTKGLVELTKKMDDIDMNIESIVGDVLKDKPISAKLEYNADTEALTIKMSN